MLLKDSSFAVYDNAQATKEYEQYKNCSVIETGVPYFPVTFTYAMPKSSPYFAAFQYHIEQLKEIGVIKRYHYENQGEWQICEEYGGKPITEGQCFTAFTILLAGAIISFLWLM